MTSSLGTVIALTEAEEKQTTLWPEEILSACRKYEAAHYISADPLTVAEMDAIERRWRAETHGTKHISKADKGR